jgi:hypothetical protein
MSCEDSIIKCILNCFFTVKISLKNKLTEVYLGLYNMNTSKKFGKTIFDSVFRACCTISMEIWRHLEIIQALSNFSKMIGEKSQTR